jgi:hypothetical protein
VRFYQEIAPAIDVRVPACYDAQVTDEGTALMLEDLASWQPGADPLAAGRVLSGMHRGWVGRAHVRWPWLRPVGLAAELVEELFASGDASLLNMRTGPHGEIALLDWEDVSAAPGVVDLGWLLVSSVDPAQRDEVIARYGPADGLPRVLAATAVQGLLSMSDSPTGSAAARGWIQRLDAAANRLRSAP